MQWNSVTDFFVMGGHGYYVWCAYAMAAFLVAAESVSLFLGRHVAKNAVKKRSREACGPKEGRDLVNESNEIRRPVLWLQQLPSDSL